METFIREACLVAGFCSAVAGLWMIYAPAALIVGGAALVWIGLPPKPGDRK